MNTLYLEHISFFRKLSFFDFCTLFYKYLPIKKLPKMKKILLRKIVKMMRNVMNDENDKENDDYLYNA